MSFPSAYSLELNTDLSAKEAYDFSRSPVGSPHHLTDAKKFQCGENCSFTLTLTNFNNPNFTKEPYFTPGARNQIHDSSCQRMIERYNQREKEVKRENHTSFYREKNKLIIDLDLIRGTLATITKPRQKEEGDSSLEANNTNVREQHSQSDASIDDKTFRSHVKQLSTLIRYFLEYKSGEKYTFYSKDKRELNIERYFINLAETSQRQINLEEVHIYYDKASVISKKDYFLVIFNSECTLDGTTSRPSIIINKKRANHHGVKEKMKVLEKASKDKKTIQLFYFGKFHKHISKSHINPDVESEYILDYLVIN